MELLGVSLLLIGEQGHLFCGRHFLSHIIRHRAANCPGFAGAIPDFTPCPRCPIKWLQCPRFYGFHVGKQSYKN